MFFYLHLCVTFKNLLIWKIILVIYNAHMNKTKNIFNNAASCIKAISNLKQEHK